MKVLKQAPAFAPRRYICPHCNAELEADSLDDYERHTGCDQRDGDSWDYLIVTCPCCQGGIRVNSAQSGIPAHLLGRIKDGG